MEKKSLKQYGDKTANQQTVQQLNQFINQMNNKDTLSTDPSKSQLKRQRTAAATINARDDSASGQ